MIEVTNLLATKQYMVKRENETYKVQVVPQMVSTLRKELTFWGYYEGFDFFTHDFSEIINPKIVLMIDF